jgi:hypothetical protein
VIQRNAPSASAMKPPSHRSKKANAVRVHLMAYPSPHWHTERWSWSGHSLQHDFFATGDEGLVLAMARHFALRWHFDFKFHSSCHAAQHWTVFAHRRRSTACTVTATTQHFRFRSVVGPLWAMVDTDGRTRIVVTYTFTGARLLEWG